MQPTEQALLAMVPTDKIDTDKVAALKQLGYPAIEPILPQLLEWLQDMNWPVAQELHPLLAGIGAPLAPHVGKILRGDDDIWIYWILGGVVAYSPPLAACLRNELELLAERGSKQEGVRTLAREILDGDFSKLDE